MSRPGAQEIAIERLRISGDQNAARIFARELEVSSWPLQLPAHLQHAWVFVRELNVHGKPQQLRNVAADELNQALSNLVSANAASANTGAVRFDSLPQLLAFLVRDLSLGQAKSKWYWQRWNYLFCVNAEQSITQLLIENIAELPAVVEQLTQMGQLALLWKSFSSNTAGALVIQFGRHCGFDIQSHKSNDKSEEKIQHYVHNSFPKSPDFLRHWKNFSSTPENDQRWQLAAVLTGIKYCPLLVLKHPHVVIDVFKLQLNLSGSQAMNSIGADNRAPVGQHNLWLVENTSEAKSGRNKMSADISGNTKISKIKDSSSDLLLVSAEKKLQHQVADTEFAKHEPSNLLPSTEISGFLADETTDTQAEDSELPTGFQEYFTQQGGFFYLINALQMVITADFLAENIYANGWRWWFDVARLFAQRFGVSLDVSLTRFAVSTTNAADIEELINAPISHEAEILFVQLNDLFSNQDFWKRDCGKFISIPSHIIFDASHIDIYFPLNTVRLDIRLAGLDINPGWVPWLGSVVRFHYVDSPQLGASDFSGAGHAH